ncbi:MAG: helix-turn-helix transcriptional regulator [Lachnospiraceae bacterium]|nr:helix-turn-helix transcriptional regulator [Lachnospiraceae bacterium]
MEENQFELHRIGYHFIHCAGVDINRPRGTGDYLFLYLKSNVMILTEEGEIQTVEPSFILYEKGFSQRYYDYQGPFINDWMHFDRQDAAEFFQKLDIPVNKLMIIQNSNDISSMMQDLRIEFKQRGKYHKEILDSKIKVMFYKFSDIYHEEIKFSDKLNRYRRDFNEVRNRIYNFTPDNMISGVNEIAASLNLSTSYFQHIYKQLFGVSVMNDIIKSRIEYACYLLSSNSDSISEIAFRCGYENKEHFTRQFKDITGYTPRQYREKR